MAGIFRRYRFNCLEALVFCGQVFNSVTLQKENSKHSIRCELSYPEAHVLFVRIIIFGCPEIGNYY